ncbi:MAG: UDP-N-acetylmuramoyl-tripeptide--D-alanyl-D-alanine ligase [Lysobacterales bacterium]
MKARKERPAEKENRYSLADIPHLIRSPLGRIQFREGIYYRLWPLLSVLASAYRRVAVSNTRIVSVVGSFGKTTTARALTCALQKQVHENMSRNSWSYVSGSVLRIRPHDRHAVIEVGINNTGQMKQYARMIRPDITVVTSIGSEHHRSLGSLKVTRSEKAEMVKALPRSGLAVINGDDPNVRWMADLTEARVIKFGFDESNDVRASNVKLVWPEGTHFNLHINGEKRAVRSSLFGSHMVYPVLAAIAVATAEGLSLEQMLSSLESMPPTPGRLERVQLPGGAILLRDDFKSSLETVHAALDVFSEIPAGRRGIVLGEVSEPRGSQGPIYRELGRRIASMADFAVFVGGNFQRYSAGARRAGFPKSAMRDAGGSVHKAAECLRNELRPGDTVLLKGRDTQRLERISLILEGRTVRCDIEFCDTRVVSCRNCPMLERGWEGLRVVI